MKFLFAALFLIPSLSFGATGFGVVKLVKGKAVLGVSALKAGDLVQLNDVVTTGPKSFVRILLNEGVALQVGPDSTVRLERGEGEPTTVDLLKGYLLSRVKKSDPAADRDRFRVRTASASLGVRGTTFFAQELGGSRTFLCVCEGTVEARWAKGDLKITAKHHDAPVTITGSNATAENAPMGHEHTDAEIAELDKLLE